METTEDLRAASAAGGYAPTPREEARVLVRIAAPLAAGFLAEMAMNVTDTIIVGRLGNVELAGVGLAASVLFNVLFVCMAVVSIVGVLAAQAHGAGNPAAIGHAVRQGFWVATLLSLPAMLLGWYLPPILRWLDQDPAVIAVAQTYLHGLVWCFLPYMWFTVLRNFVSALARAGSVMIITIAAIGLNLVLVYVFVFGIAGWEGWGVAGAGIGTSLVCWAMFVALAAHAVRAKAFRGYRVFHGLLRFDGRLSAEILRLGLPVAGMSAVESGLFLAVQLLIGTLGAAALAANQIAFSICAISFMIPAAIGQAATMRVAYGMGAGSVPAARQAGFIAIGFSAGYMALMAVLLWLFSREVASLYLDRADPANAGSLALAAVLVGIAAVFQIVDGVQVTAVGALRGIKDTTVPFAIGLVGYWGIGLGSGYIFAFLLGHGAVGLWWGLALGLAASASLLTWRFHRRTRALLRAAAEQPAPLPAT
jgi:MATE family multidrug resistance protein